MGSEDSMWGGTADGQYSHNFKLTGEAGESLGIDFGDAPTAVQSGLPADYPTTIAQNSGFRHTATGFFLGAHAEIRSLTASRRLLPMATTPMVLPMTKMASFSLRPWWPVRTRPSGGRSLERAF